MCSFQTEGSSGGPDSFEAARAAMVEEIAREVRATRDLLGKDRLDERVIAALGRVPRHAFVSPEHRAFAYENRPLPIGQRQTISQPYIVAVMTDFAAVEEGSRILEVGTGCGYQAALLAELGGQVTTIERIPELAARAADLLRRLGYHQVQVETGDGSRGWPANAPYDAILVTAAAPNRVPQALLEQLAPGGRLIIPLDCSGFTPGFLSLRAEQELVLVQRAADGQISQRVLLPVAFVPLIADPG